MTNEHAKILAKLEKLVALAGSDNEHEANLAMETALRIAAENNIELSQISQQSRPKAEMKKEDVSKGSARLSVTHTYVSSILKQFFEVKVITGGNRASGRKIWFVGKQENIDFAKFLYNYLEIPSLNFGMHIMKRINMQRMHGKAISLACGKV